MNEDGSYLIGYKGGQQEGYNFICINQKFIHTINEVGAGH